MTINIDENIEIISILGNAPDHQLDAHGSKMCREWLKSRTEVSDRNDTVKFIRNLLDLCVRYAWSSSFVIVLLQVLLEEELAETEEESEARRSELLKIWEPGEDVL